MRYCLCLAVLTIFLGLAQTGQAQTITNLENERGLRYPGTIPYDGEPYTQRYNYGTRGMFYFNSYGAQLQYLDYLDRADRARKFGYRMPIDPFFETPFEELEGQPIEAPPTVAAPPVRVIGGFGFGHWRRR